jgi:methionyl-tRNA formyltransferase
LSAGLARPLRVIFAGTPEFARVALQSIHAAGHTVALVLTQPDRPAGRGMKLQASAVKQYAQAHGMPVAQPRSLRLDGKFPQDAAQARAAIAAADADVMVVAAYGLILPQWVLDDLEIPPRLGCLNIHGSVLPRWRGAAPIHRAIEAGDGETGVTIMQMDAGLDTGAMLLVESLPIEDVDTTATLHDKVAALGANMMVRVLAVRAGAGLAARPQDAQGVTYAHKIEKHEAAIDWRQDAATICRRVRAFNPFPGASLQFQGEAIKVWRAEVSNHALSQGVSAGAVVAVSPCGIVVATGAGSVLLTELQRAGGKRLSVADFLRGFEMQVGMQLQ